MVVGTLIAAVGAVYTFIGLHTEQWLSLGILSWIPEAPDKYILPLDFIWNKVSSVMEPNGYFGMQLLFLGVVLRNLQPNSTVNSAGAKSIFAKFKWLVIILFIWHIVILVQESGAFFTFALFAIIIDLLLSKFIGSKFKNVIFKSIIFEYEK